MFLPQNFTNEINSGSGNGLVPLGNKPLPELMLTLYVYQEMFFLYHFYQFWCDLIGSQQLNLIKNFITYNLTKNLS